MTFTFACVESEIALIYLDWLLIVIKSPTLISVPNCVPVPTINGLLFVTFAVPETLDGWISICVIVPFALTAFTAAAAPLPLVCAGFGPKTISSPTW